MKLARELNPDALRRPQSKNKVCSDREFVEVVLGEARPANGDRLPRLSRKLNWLR